MARRALGRWLGRFVGDFDAAPALEPIRLISAAALNPLVVNSRKSRRVGFMSISLDPDEFIAVEQDARQQRKAVLFDQGTRRLRFFAVR